MWISGPDLNPFDVSILDCDLDRHRCRCAVSLPCRSVAQILGPRRAGLGTFFGMGLVFLYFVVYRIYVKIERIEQNLTKTIQELALRDDWVNRR